MSDRTVQAGCTKCGTQFYLPVDAETGQPIWAHSCSSPDEKLDEMKELLKKLVEGKNEHGK